VSRGTQEPTQRASVDVVYGAVTLSGRPFQAVRLSCWLVTRRPHGPAGPTTPVGKPTGLGCSAFARRYWRNHCCFLFLWVLRWFTSPRSPPRTYGFSPGYLGMSRGGLPHSDISGSKPACGSPELIAACHVLHRLLAPRHSPHALSSLTTPILEHSDFVVGKRLPFAGYSVVKDPAFAPSGSGEASTRLCAALTTFITSHRLALACRARLRLAISDQASTGRRLVENTGLEPVTSWLQTRRSPS
jgi:hypothetical protein